MPCASVSEKPTRVCALNLNRGFSSVPHAARDRRQQEHSDARRPAHPVDEPDPVRGQRRARAQRRAVVPVGMVAYRPQLPPAPPREQPDREQHDDYSHGGLGDLPHDLGQVLAKEHERQPYKHQGSTVAEAPEKAHEPGLLHPATFLF